MVRCLCASMHDALVILFCPPPPPFRHMPNQKIHLEKPIVGRYLEECAKYGVEGNSGVLVALRFQLPILRPTKPFHCKVVELCHSFRLVFSTSSSSSEFNIVMQLIQEKFLTESPGYVHEKTGHDSPCRGADAPGSHWRSAPY